jgi:hypothetical protein
MPNKSPESLRECPFGSGCCPEDCDVNFTFRHSKSYLKEVNFGSTFRISENSFSRIITRNPNIEPIARKACRLEKNKKHSGTSEDEVTIRSKHF